MNITTRTAPPGARMMNILAASKAFALLPLSLRVRGGQVQHFATAAEMNAAIQRMSVSAVAANPATGQPEPAPAAPNTPADTAARLDAHDAELADHAARIAGLEQRSPPPAPVDTGAQAAPPAASAVAAAPVAKMVSSAEIYGRMNARAAGLKAAVPVSSAPAVIQTSSGPMLDTRAMYAKLNTTAAARVRRA